MNWRFGPSVQKFFDKTLSHDAVQALVSAREVRIVEISDSSFTADTDGSIRRAFKNVLGTTRIRVETFHSQLADFSSENPALLPVIEARIEQTLLMAREFGAAILICHSGEEPTDPARRRHALDINRQRFLALADRAQKLGIKIAVELLPRTCLGNTIEEVLYLSGDGTHPNLGICFDVNHSMERIAEVPDYIRRLRGRIITVHLSDYDGTDEKHWFPGRGKLDWRAVMNAFKEIEYQGPFAYECPAEGSNYIEKCLALDTNIRWLRSLVAW